MTRPILLFAHGAGLGKDAPWMTRWATALDEVGEVVRFDYPYMAAGRKRPDRLEVLLAHHEQMLREVRADRPERPVVLVGKSMGARVGCHLANRVDEPVRAVICLGYPLVSPGKRASLRDQVLRDLRTPVLFVQGTRDRLCPLESLAQARQRMAAPNELFVVEGGDHSLALRKRELAERGLTQEGADREAMAAISGFVARYAQTA